MNNLDSNLIEIFCNTFGEQCRPILNPETNMDDIPDWDSLTFFEIVMKIEEQYGVTFTDTEAAQMFQLGHIQRIINHARLDQPHDDIAHACCQLYMLGKTTYKEKNVAILSGSSTREGLLPPQQGLEALRKKAGDSSYNWFNISVSGLVAAEALQFIETIGRHENGIIVLGFSPCIYGGCGQAEFTRAAKHQRYPFAAPEMDSILSKYGYKFNEDEKRPSISVEIWVERYLKGRDLSEFTYNPYIYPTLEPWTPAKHEDEQSILRYYNNSLLNYEESMKINEDIFESIARYCQEKDIRLALLQLTLHSKTLEFIERLGEVASKAETFRKQLCSEYDIPYIAAVDHTGINDSDYRDPGHIFHKREEYTQAVIEGVLDLMDK